MIFNVTEKEKKQGNILIMKIYFKILQLLFMGNTPKPLQRQKF